MKVDFTFLLRCVYIAVANLGGLVISFIEHCCPSKVANGGTNKHDREEDSHGYDVSVTVLGQLSRRTDYSPSIIT